MEGIDSAEDGIAISRTTVTRELLHGMAPQHHKDGEQFQRIEILYPFLCHILYFFAKLQNFSYLNMLYNKNSLPEGTRGREWV